MLAKNKSGHHLLAFFPLSEDTAMNHPVYKPITGAFAFIQCEGKFLIGYNPFRNQWEFPAGKIEAEETPRACAIRELFEETNQVVTTLEFKGIFQVYDSKKDEVRYRMAYMGNLVELRDFHENDEMRQIMLWDLKQDVGYVDAVDLTMLQLCLKSKE